jgi:hypothetical protein
MPVRCEWSLALKRDKGLKGVATDDTDPIAKGISRNFFKKE